MKSRRAIAFALFLLASALIAGPGAKLYAASPCHTGAPMACCGGEGDDGAPAPCGCSLSPMTPSPSIAETASEGVVLFDAPALVPALAEPDPVSAAPRAPVTPRARAAPLFILFAAFQN